MHVKRKLKKLLSRRTKACDNESGPADRWPDHTQQEEVDANTSERNGHDSEPLTGQSRLSIPKPAPTSEAIDAPIDELWDLAYEHLRESDGHLIADYEDKLGGNFAIGMASTLGSRADVRNKMKTVLQRKMDEVNRDAWKLKFRSSEVQVKDLVQPVLGVVNWANEYISAAVGANPSASIAWAGISLLLPLFLNPSKQAASLAKGLEHVASLIARSYMWESLYTRRCQSSSSSNTPTRIVGVDPITYKDALEMLYQHILRFQITGYCYYASNTTLRLGQDLIQWNEWEGLLSKIRDQEVNVVAVNNIWRDGRYAEECVEAEKRHKEAICQWQHIGKDVSGLLDALRSGQEEKNRRGLLQWLCMVDISEGYNAARSKHVEGTSDWLLRDSEEYDNWEAGPSSLLWLHGKAGCGKSVLSSSIINDIKDRYESDPQTALAYFFFSFSDSNKQKVDVMLASLVKQLYASRPDTPQAIETLEGYRTRDERPDTKTLESALLATTQGFAATFIIIDALDECPSLNGEREKLMTSFCRIISAMANNVHVLCTSRAEADIVAAMSSFSCATSSTRTKLDLNEQRRRIDRDIGLYIESTFASPAYSSWPLEIKEEAKRSLTEKAEGMFQYVSSQFEALQNLSSPKAVREAIKQLPVGLDATYDRILMSLEPNYWTQIASSLQWLALSTRDLTVEELAEVFILRPDNDVPFDEAERLFKPEDCVKYLSNLVVTVVNQDDETQQYRNSSHKSCTTYIRLAHFTVKEYLISGRIKGPAANFSFTEIDAHLYITRSSLRYFLHCIDFPRERIGDFKLIDYTSVNWTFHLEMVPREMWSPDVIKHVLHGLAAHSAGLRKATIGRRELLLPHAERLDAPYFYTAREGFLELTELLLGGGPGRHPYLTQSDMNMALREAAKGGSIAVVQLLLAKGADLNSENEIHGGTLQAAAYAGHTEVVQLLLDSGADIDAHRGPWGSALEAAVLGYQLDVVQLLLKRNANVGCALIMACDDVSEFGSGCLRILLDSGADVNWKCDTHGTALHQLAMQMDHRPTEVVKAFHLLLERGADVNLPGGDYGYPLQALCASSAPIQAVMLLLSRGANANAKGGEYGSALQALFCIPGDFASQKGVAGLLLERGADVNMEGGYYGSALHAACAVGDGIDAVQFLLEKGADIGIESDNLGTVLHAACQFGNQEIVRFLLDKGADVNALGGEFGSALQAAAACGSDGSGNILRLLLSRGADVSAQGGHYGTALQAACRHHNIDTVRLLLDLGADVNVVSGIHGTALQAACHNQSEPDVARLLVERGADVHLRGGELGSAWHAGAAEMDASREDVLAWLLDHGIDIDEVRGGEHGTALQTALALEIEYSFHYKFARAKNDIPFRAKRVRFLLDHGANVNIGGGKNAFPLQSACAKEQNSELTSLLLATCPDIEINAAGGLFGSALQAAVHSRQEDSVHLLLEKGADINARGGRYGSALNAAVFRGFWEIAEILLDKGAIPDSKRLPEPDEQWLEGVRATFADQEWIPDDYLIEQRGFTEKHIARIRVDASRAAVERYRKFWEKTRTVGACAHVLSEN